MKRQRKGKEQAVERHGKVKAVEGQGSGRSRIGSETAVEGSGRQWKAVEGQGKAVKMRWKVKNTLP